jgi:oligogalacturonide lyase
MFRMGPVCSCRRGKRQTLAQLSTGRFVNPLMHCPIKPVFSSGITRTLCAVFFLATLPMSAQIGRRFPSEKKVIPDPVTGIPLTFLTTQPGMGDSKIYPTHQQWSADGKWVIFRSNRVPGQAMAVNEMTGDIVQLTEDGYTGMLCAAPRSMKLFFMRDVSRPPPQILGEAAPPPAGLDNSAEKGAAPNATAGATAASQGQPASGGQPRAAGAPGGANRSRGPFQIIELNLEKLFADSAAGTLKGASEYERICGTIPTEMRGGGDLAIDANEEVAYFRVNGPDLASKLPEGTKVAETFGPRGMGAGPAGIGRMDLKTGESKLVVAVPFQVGHIQTNPFVPGEIVFCWETGGKAPQRTWTVNGDGSGLRPLYPEAAYEWITHEAIVSKDEVALGILGHRRIGLTEADQWGVAGSADHPTGLGIVNLRTREMRIVGQVPMGDRGRSFWHVHASPDGRWAVGDDFQYRLWLIDRKSGEMILLTDNGHKTTAQDHQHPTFSTDSTRIQFQSAMLAENGRSMNIVIVPVPEAWLKRTYSAKIQ